MKLISAGPCRSLVPAISTTANRAVEDLSKHAIGQHKLKSLVILVTSFAGIALGKVPEAIFVAMPIKIMIGYRPR